MSRISAAAFSDTKPHYDLLDGLRGVAALTVVCFHLFEAYATSHLDQRINHGYLAVDFFFALSGFVIGYAYDDRWGRMTVGGFFKRRLIRLQPMVVLGMAVGAALFYFQDCDMWPVHAVPVWKMLAVMLVGMTLLPVPVSMDVRGWQEMHPLNGPGWSLFYEYCANILYALVVRRFPKWLLGVLVAVSGAALIRFALTSPSGDIIGGWSLTAEQLGVGFTRMMYPFFGGLLLSRLVRPGHVRRAFWWCSLGLVALLAVPRVVESVLPQMLRPAHRLDGCERYGDGAFGACLRVSWRYLLSDLYHPLPARLHLHGVGAQPWPHARRGMARCGRHGRRERPAGLRHAEMVRRAGAPLAPARIHVGTAVIRVPASRRFRGSGR